MRIHRETALRNGADTDYFVTHDSNSREIFLNISRETSKEGGGEGGGGQEKKKATEQENTHKYSTSHLLYLGEFFSCPIPGHKIPKATTFSKESN